MRRVPEGVQAAPRPGEARGRPPAGEGAPVPAVRRRIWRHRRAQNAPAATHSVWAAVPVRAVRQGVRVRQESAGAQGAPASGGAGYAAAGRERGDSRRGRRIRGGLEIDVEMLGAAGGGAELAELRR